VKARGPGPGSKLLFHALFKSAKVLTHSYDQVEAFALDMVLKSLSPCRIGPGSFRRLGLVSIL
jgi:hypothetical protein